MTNLSLMRGNAFKIIYQNVPIMGWRIGYSYRLSTMDWQQYSWDFGCCYWRCIPITHHTSCNSSYGEDGLQPWLEWRTSLDPQERWRYASTQCGRHVIYQDGPADEEAWRSSQWEARSHTHSWFSHDMWRVWKYWAFREQLPWNPRGCEFY